MATTKLNPFVAPFPCPYLYTHHLAPSAWHPFPLANAYLYYCFAS
jgi:hypothetical protein